MLKLTTGKLLSFIFSVVCENFLRYPNNREVEAYGVVLAKRNARLLSWNETDKTAGRYMLTDHEKFKQLDVSSRIAIEKLLRVCQIDKKHQLLSIVRRFRVWAKVNIVIEAFVGWMKHFLHLSYFVWVLSLNFYVRFSKTLLKNLKTLVQKGFRLTTFSSTVVFRFSI